VIFDTDVLIWFFWGGDGAAKDLLQSHRDRAMSIVSLMELFQGARSLTELKVIRRFFPANGIQVIPINESLSHAAATLMEEYWLRNGLQLADALIAATARETAAVLATGNVRHFRSISRLELKTFRPSRTKRG
jgi:predicted nucleic acid-binding protein